MTNGCGFMWVLRVLQTVGALFLFFLFIFSFSIRKSYRIQTSALYRRSSGMSAPKIEYSKSLNSKALRLTLIPDIK